VREGERPVSEGVVVKHTPGKGVTWRGRVREGEKVPGKREVVCFAPGRTVDV